MKQTTVLFKTIPEGFPTDDCFEVVHSDFDPTSVPLDDGQMVAKVLYLSADPYLRGRMRPAHIPSYSPAFIPGKPMDGLGIAEVLVSKRPGFASGDRFVTGLCPWSSYAVLAADNPVQKIEPSDIPIEKYLGVLGMPGMTAYYGLIYKASPKKGETLYVSAAAGAVGQLVCQLGKLRGLRVVGSAGDDEKVKFLIDELKIDAAFNYKKTEDYDAKLRELCPNGIDIYFENVGGPMLDAVFSNMNVFGRIIACGMISQYNKKERDPIKNLMVVIPKRLSVLGILVSDCMKTECAGLFMKEVSGYVRDKSIKYKEDIITGGIERAPEALLRVLTGANNGKQLLKVVGE